MKSTVYIVDNKHDLMSLPFEDACDYVNKNNDLEFIMLSIPCVFGDTKKSSIAHFMKVPVSVDDPEHGAEINKFFQLSPKEKTKWFVNVELRHKSLFCYSSSSFEHAVNCFEDGFQWKI